MRYAVYFEMPDGHNVGNVHETEAEHSADDEAEITKGDDYVVSNPRNIFGSSVLT